MVVGTGAALTVSGTGAITATGLTGTPNIAVGTVNATAITGTGILSNSQAGAASASAVSITGAPYTGGSGTTTYPLVYFNQGTAPTTWSTSGTEFGINAPSGFAGNFLDFHLNGGASLLSVNQLGGITMAQNNGFLIVGTNLQLSSQSGLNIARNSTGSQFQTYGISWSGTSSYGSSVTNIYSPSAGFVAINQGVSNPSGDSGGTLLANTANLNEMVVTPLATPVNIAFSTATTGGTLAPGTYYYRVAAIDAFGTSLASTETSQVVPAGTSTNTVRVNWNVVNGAYGYKVYGRTTGAELFMATLGTGATTTFLDNGSITPSGALPVANTTGNSVLGNLTEVSVTPLATPVNATFTQANTGGSLVASTTYYYRVAALDAFGTSLASTETSVATSSAAPSTHTVTVNWNIVPGATSYNVYGRTTGAEQLIANVPYLIPNPGLAASVIYGLSYVDTGSVTPSGALPTANTTGNISVGGGHNYGVNTQSGNYTLAVSDYIVVFTATATATINSALPVGTTYRIKFTGSSGSLTISPSAGTIDGASTLVIGQQYQSVDITLIASSNWGIF